jgi:hypothetical protein
VVHTVGSHDVDQAVAEMVRVLRGCPETNVQQINLLGISKSMARDRLSSKSVLSLARHVT